MIKTLSLVLVALIFALRPAEAGLFDFTHSAALMLGQGRERILSQAEHILKQPKDVVYYFEGQPDQIEARRYSFNTQYDIILFFGKGVFLALDSIPPDSNSYPKLKRDFQSIHKPASLLGYVVLKTGNNITMQVLSK